MNKVFYIQYNWFLILEGINCYQNARNQLILLSQALPKESREQTSDN